MAWTYTLGPYDATAAGLRNQVRFRLGDTDPARQLVQDEEIAYLLAANNNDVVATTIGCARAVLGRFATRPDRETVGDVTIDWSGIRERLRDLIATLQAGEATIAPPRAEGVVTADMDDYKRDATLEQPAFTRDLYLQGIKPQDDLRRPAE